MDRGDEIIGNLLSICEKESIPSAVFSGIGGCQSAELQVFIPERLRVGERSSGMTGSFETEQLEAMLELVSLNGNVVRDDDGKLFHHTHALFSFKKDGQHGMAHHHHPPQKHLPQTRCEHGPRGDQICPASGTRGFIGILYLKKPPQLGGFLNALLDVFE